MAGIHATGLDGRTGGLGAGGAILLAAEIGEGIGLRSRRSRRSMGGRRSGRSSRRWRRALMVSMRATITATVMIIGWLGHRGTGKQHAYKRRGNQQSGHGLYPFRYPTG
jgi:hypothetical protein